MGIRGLIFDCDGTLADTMPFHWKAWQTVIQRHQLHFREDRFYSLVAVTCRDIVLMLAKEQGRELDHLEVARQKEAAYLPFLPSIRPIELVVKIARENAGKLPMAVASGGSKRVIEQVLQHLQIR